MDVLLSPVADLARTDLSLDIAASPVPAPPAPVAAQGQAAEPGHSRMIIEERDGRYIYKIYDPRTGEVLRQVPREELLRHREALQEAAERLQSGQSPVSQLGAVIV